MDVKLDVDGVLRDIDERVIHYYKVFYNPDAKIKKSDINIYKLHEHFPEVKNFDNFFKEHAKGIFQDSLPYPGAVDFTRRLDYDGHNIHIVTRQMPGVENYTVEWLRKHGFKYDTLHFTKDKTIVKGDVTIEDNLENLIECSWDENVVCFAQNWNRGFSGFRTNDYNAIANHINNLDEWV